MREGTFTPFDFYRMMGERFGMNGIRNGMERRMDPAIFSGEEEINNLTTYVYQMMVREKSGELCLSKVIAPFAFTRKSLEADLHLLHDIPMAFLYGEYDWGNRATPDRLIAEGRIQGEVF